MTFPRALLWDIFCRVIDNHGDLGVCWRLARELAARGQRARLWVDDASALAWMAPEALAQAVPGVRLRCWSEAEQADALGGLERADVWIEAFGCELPDAFVAAGVARTADGERPPVWINLEYLSAEDWVLRTHGLPSPVLHGPAAGWTKWFFYPGLAAGTGGLLREQGLQARQQAFRRSDWLAAHGVPWQGERLISLFCYEPPVLAEWLAQQAAASGPSRVLVTAGRARQAVAQALGLSAGPGDGALLQHGRLGLVFLPYLSQTDFDHMLWTCDLNFVRGEDSLVRALWAGKPWVWQPYVQDDGAHHAKLEALLRWAGGPASWQALHRAWSGVDKVALPVLSIPDWQQVQALAQQLRERLLLQDDLLWQLQRWVLEKR